MSAPTPVNSSITGPKHEAEERLSCDYHPSVWGDHFIRYAPKDDSSDFRSLEEEHRRKIEGLVAEVEAMLSAKKDKGSLLEQLNLVDQLQRLGIAYLFEAAISEHLDTLYENSQDSFSACSDNLHATALLFRLLRQQGHPTSCEVFTKFKTSEGFCHSLHSDLRGLLSLYEASHLRVHGEDILEDANAFTTARLHSILEVKSCPGDDLLKKQANHALRIPIRKGIPRIEARLYIPIYREDPSRDNTLYSLAVLDFNSLQEQHRQELGIISRWWKNLDIARKLPWARDRVVECYFWILGVYFEPSFALARRMLTKVFLITSVIDDLYDVYGTMEELKMFDQAVERWDRDAVKDLPDYLEWLYNVFLDIYDEIYEATVNMRGQTYRHDYAVQGMKELVRTYHEEARFYYHGRVPPLEEYLRVTFISSGYQMLVLTSFIGMGDVATEDAFKWTAERPKILQASEIVCRLMDDIAGYKIEKKRGHFLSAVDCYMKEHLDATADEAKGALYARVIDAWKDINQGCLRPTLIPMPLLTRILNFTRVIHTFYNDKNNYTYSKTSLKEYIRCTIAEPLTK